MNRKQMLAAIVDAYEMAQDYVSEVESAIREIQYELEDDDVAEVDFEQLYSDADDVSSYFRQLSNIADEIDESDNS